MTGKTYCTSISPGGLVCNRGQNRTGDHLREDWGQVQERWPNALDMTQASKTTAQDMMKSLCWETAPMVPPSFLQKNPDISESHCIIPKQIEHKRHITGGADDRYWWGVPLFSTVMNACCGLEVQRRDGHLCICVNDGTHQLNRHHCGICETNWPVRSFGKRKTTVPVREHLLRVLDEQTDHLQIITNSVDSMQVERSKIILVDELLKEMNTHGNG